MVSIRTIAVVLVVVGAVAFAFPTVAFSEVNTQRPTSFSIGSEDEALVSFEETGKTVTHPEKGPQTVTVGKLVNNFDSDLTLNYRVQTGSSAVKVDTESTPVELQPGNSADITAQCRGSGSDSTATVTATVTSAYADGVGVEDVEFDFTVEYDCREPNPGDGGDGDDGDDDDGDDGDDDDGDDGDDGDDDDGDDGDDDDGDDGDDDDGDDGDGNSGNSNK